MQNKRISVALKENLNAIKQGLSTEEQFLEGMIKGERFLKKYKWPLVLVLVLGLAGGVGYAVMDTIEKNNLQSSNEAYLALLEDPSDTAARAVLQETNPSLYQTYLTKQALASNAQTELEAVLASDTDALLKDLAAYQLDQTSGELLANLTALQRGYLLLQEGKRDEALREFEVITHTSPLQNVVKNLEHYQGE
jgi:predicted negative regulator of RcsB-dependent stress response